MRNELLIMDRKKISKIIFFIIIVMPFIRYYNLPGISIGLETVCLILLFLLCIALQSVTSNNNKKKSINLKKSRINFLFFSLWLFLITIFYELCTNLNINNPASNYTINTFIMLIPTIIIIITLLDTRIKTEGLFLMYEKFVYIVIIVYILQWILMLINVKIAFNLPFFKYTDSWSYLEQIVFGMNNRPTSLFSEQAHMCEYLIPYLAICLYSNCYKKKFLKAILVSAIMVSTVSGNGIVVVCIQWACYFLIFGRMNITYRFLLILLGIVIFIGLYNYLMGLPVFNKMFKELFINTTGKYTSTKADYRVYRGFDYYFQFPPLQKIIGVGYKHMNAFACENGIFSKYDNATNAFEFFSTITQVLLYTGIVGFVFFVKHLYALWNSKSYLVKGMLISFVAIWFSSQMLFANTYIMYIVFIIIACLEDEKFHGGRYESKSIDNSANI